MEMIMLLVGVLICGFIASGLTLFLRTDIPEIAVFFISCGLGMVFFPSSGFYVVWSCSDSYFSW